MKHMTLATMELFMSLDLTGIEKGLAQINQTLIQQSKEMSYLREQVSRLVELNTPKLVAAVIETLEQFTFNPIPCIFGYRTAGYRTDIVC